MSLHLSLTLVSCKFLFKILDIFIRVLSHILLQSQQIKQQPNQSQNATNNNLDIHSIVHGPAIFTKTFHEHLYAMIHQSSAVVSAEVELCKKKYKRFHWVTISLNLLNFYWRLHWVLTTLELLLYYVHLSLLLVSLIF